MTAPPSIDIGTLITRTPGVRGGRPCIAGTGVSVMRVAIYNNMGYTPEEIVAGYGHLTLAQVHAVLAYYYSNKAEVDSDIADEEAAFRREEQARRA
jgi:uncharacterized protein (DUF433 family)